MSYHQRSFTIEYNGIRFGRVISFEPSYAAKKAMGNILRKYNKGIDDNKWIIFCVAETTRNSSGVSTQWTPIKSYINRGLECQM